MDEISAKKKERDSNFELLRIVAMFLIVMAHMGGHGVWFAQDSEPTVNFLIARFNLGDTGNMLFMLISGWFMANAKFSWRKIFKLRLQIFSISAAIGIFAYISKIPVVSHWHDEETYHQNGFFATAHPTTPKELVRTLLPTYFGNNWFTTAYIAFYFFAPFCAVLFNSLDERRHRNLLFAMLFFGTIVPFFPMQGIFRCDDLFSFVLCFCAADYIRRYDPLLLKNTRRNIAIAAALLTFFVVWHALVHLVLLDRLPILREHLGKVVGIFRSRHSITGMSFAVLIFCVFRDIKIPHSRFINTVASATFGVYLLHENLLVNKTLWHVVCRLDGWTDSPWLLPYMIFCAAAVFAACTVVELLRQRLVERPLFRLLGSKRKKA